MSRIEQLRALHEADPLDADVLYMLAQEHAKLDETDEAVAWYDRCLGVDPLYCYAYFHKARALEDAGRIAEAVAVLEVGVARAREARDEKALGEIGQYLDQLSDEA